MDQRQFDELTRCLAQRPTRRRLLRLLAGGLATRAVPAGLLAAPAVPSPVAPPPLPPFPAVCSKPTAPLPTVTITPLARNQIGGSCQDFIEFTKRNAVVKPDGTSEPLNSPAVTVAAIGFTFKTASKNTEVAPGVFCAELTLKYPDTLDIPDNTKVFMQDWTDKPTNPSDPCRQAWDRYAGAIIAHEARHLADDRVILATLRARWSHPRRYRFCATDNDAANQGLQKLLDHDLNADQAAAARQVDACGNAFHASKAGGKNPDMDCGQCCAKGQKPCNGRCCQNGLVCATVASSVLPGRAFPLVQEECVCPDDRLPCGGVCCGANESCEGNSCTATASNACLLGSWAVTDYATFIQSYLAMTGATAVSISFTGVSGSLVYAFNQTTMTVTATTFAVSGQGTDPDVGTVGVTVTLNGTAQGSYAIAPAGNVAWNNLDPSGMTFSVDISLNGTDLGSHTIDPAQSLFATTGNYHYSCQGTTLRLAMVEPAGTTQPMVLQRTG